ncbi:MAG: hypothetical protein WDN04_14320 [Rhodospirillales bacterium]
MSIERHSRARQIELGNSLHGRRKIYLDARFWIIMRDVALGVHAEPTARKLLYYLRCGVTEGRLFCPISASMFVELMKQPNTAGRRIGTAQLIDELSLGVAMIPSQIIMRTEIYSFLLRAKGGVDLHPMQELIWTKIAYVFGDMYPSLVRVSPTMELAVQKSFFDYLWNHSLSDIVKTMGDNFPRSEEFAELSRETNAKNAQHKNELRSFTQTYDIELRGVIENAGKTAADIIQELAEKETGHALSPTAEQRANSINIWCNLLYAAFKKPETKDTLRSLHIGASIHAAMRWDKGRKFVPNDYYDFEHAAAALGYCDVFLTEGSLRHLVTRPQVNLEALNNCRVFSNVEAAAAHIRQLLSSG